MAWQQTKFKEIIGVIQIVLGSLLILLPLVFVIQHYSSVCPAETLNSVQPINLNYIDCKFTSEIHNLAWFISIPHIVIGILFILQGITNMKKDILIK